MRAAEFFPLQPLPLARRKVSRRSRRRRDLSGEKQLRHVVLVLRSWEPAGKDRAVGHSVGLKGVKAALKDDCKGV
jgi:hypothetical protein